jgi:hypothetical protein
MFLNCNVMRLRYCVRACGARGARIHTDSNERAECANDRLFVSRREGSLRIDQEVAIN